MSQTKKSTPVTPNGATQAVTTTVAPPTPAAGSTTTASGTAGGVLASLGVKNTGFTQVKVASVATKAFQTKVSQRLNGAQKYLPADSNITVNGQSFTVTTIVSIFQAILGLFADKATAQEQAKNIVAAALGVLNANLPTANQFINGFDSALVSLLGKGNPVLENFGLSKGLAKTPTLVERAESVGTAKLTRTARKTMGSVQKAKVNGGTATLAITGPAGQILAGSAPAAAAPSTTAPAATGSNTGNNGNNGNSNNQ